MAHTIRTGADALLDLIREREHISVQDAANNLKTQTSCVQAWAEALSEQGDIVVKHTLSGERYCNPEYAQNTGIIGNMTLQLKSIVRTSATADADLSHKKTLLEAYEKQLKNEAAHILKRKVLLTDIAAEIEHREAAQEQETKKRDAALQEREAIMLQKLQTRATSLQEKEMEFQKAKKRFARQEAAFVTQVQKLAKNAATLREKESALRKQAKDLHRAERLVLKHSKELHKDHMRIYATSQRIKSLATAFAAASE